MQMMEVELCFFAAIGAGFEQFFGLRHWTLVDLIGSVCGFGHDQHGLFSKSADHNRQVAETLASVQLTSWIPRRSEFATSQTATLVDQLWLKVQEILEVRWTWQVVFEAVFFLFIDWYLFEMTKKKKSQFSHNAFFILNKYPKTKKWQ